MIGFILASLGSFFREVSSSIGKQEVSAARESYFSLGFLNLLIQAFIYFGIALFIRKHFLFSFDSLPTFSVRALLEVFQAHISVLALVCADRSTYSFVRTTTIPLLLFVDIILGYAIGFHQAIGVSIMFASVFLFLMNKNAGKTGVFLAGFTAVNAVVTISLFKYNITHFNSVEAEEGIITLILMFYFLFMAFARAKENPFRLLRRPMIIFQSLSSGAASTLGGFSYAFAPASLILAVERSSSVLWAILSGNFYFHETGFTQKIIFAIFLVIGFVLISI